MIGKVAARIIIDVVGVLLIVVAGILAPLPGPWSIPLALLGLGLLSKNNRWARRIMDYFKAQAGEILPPKYAKILSILVVLFFILISAALSLIIYQIKK